MDGPTLVQRYLDMVRMRRFEEACLAGVPTREIHGELHTGIGQEAVAAGLIGALRPDDALVGTHRSHLHALAKGVEARPLLAEIYERATGLCGGFGGHMHLFDQKRRFSTTGIVGANLPVALGHAWAAQLEGRDSVAVGVTGDGGANTGGFHESLNMAGAWKLPLVVLIENNEWAISVPFTDSTATPTLAERATAYGAWGRRVDGLDVEAVDEAFAEAVAHARAGNGPAILEATCYRFRGHFEGDLDLYRPAAEKDRRRQERDPLPLTRARILARGLIAEDLLDEREEEVTEEIEALLDQVRADPMPDPATARDHVFVSAKGSRA
ncbi:pyruvate dehydrogenase E1 component alpha subunit [Actinocorallia herbida]|uniref:Pyruvate dehydrogenase E1 component alpha subunit n=1 Tax=Actinocorallia herbida TaxID=58109 RepID=A0A3N1D149_9ACTN|nr:thiamine pyrophosphate-dependent dehydrogenase E1 component subunit alpha [Actinocorallia herbida]ROO87236.1 pyruvate dehydrogenase E1 component alpha subunit [Actinocorallia herbida]